MVLAGIDGVQVLPFVPEWRSLVFYGKRDSFGITFEGTGDLVEYSWRQARGDCLCRCMVWLDPTGG